MGRFVSSVDTKKIRAEGWEDGEEVIIKKFSYGDRQKLESSAVGDVSTDAKSMNMDLYEMQMVKLESGIQSWTFKDEQGKLAPVNREFIHKLSEGDGNFIEKAIDEYNPDTEKKVTGGTKPTGQPKD